MCDVITKGKLGLISFVEYMVKISSYTFLPFVCLYKEVGKVKNSNRKGVTTILTVSSFTFLLAL